MALVGEDAPHTHTYLMKDVCINEPPPPLFCPIVFCFSLIPTLEFMYMNVRTIYLLSYVLSNGSFGFLNSKGSFD